MCIVLLFCTFLACKKAEISIGGKGGGADITVYPQHHEVARNLINFRLYIKYNSLDAPSNGVYDDSLLCGYRDSLVYGSFSGLKNGNYYLYGRGFDTSISQNVQGGSPYTIVRQQAQSFDLPVSE